MVQDDKIIEVPFEKNLFKNYIITQRAINHGINKLENTNFDLNPSLFSSNSNKSIQNTSLTVSCLCENKYIRNVKLFNGQNGYFIENMGQMKIAFFKAIEFYEKIKFDIHNKKIAVNEIYGKSVMLNNENSKDTQIPFSFLVQLTIFPILSSGYYSERKKLKDYNQILFFDLFYRSSFESKTLDYLMLS